MAGVHYLRSVADVDRLRAELGPGRRAVIIGGGYIGLEVAATCREAGLEVAVLEAADRVMNRVVARRFRDSMKPSMRAMASRSCGTLASTHGDGPGNPDSSAVFRFPARHRTRSGGAAGRRQRIPADFVLVAIGVAPTDALAREAGLECDNGIVVNEFCQTSDASIWAAGDCTRHPSIHYGARVRLESVDNAFEQGTSAALNMLGIATVHDKVPWFWSDQFDLKMVIVGLAAGHDAMVLRGDPASRAFSVCYLKNGELIAVETVNHTKDQMAARKLIPARARPDLAKLADPAVALKDA